MPKLVKSIKNLERFWRQIFNLLPVISFGGTALILSALTLAPNFMNFAHAEEGDQSASSRRDYAIGKRRE